MEGIIVVKMYNNVPHSEAVLNPAASLQSFLGGVCIFSLHLCVFFLGTLVSSHIAKMCI